jgi:Flp pilus assembly protein TadG
MVEFVMTFLVITFVLFLLFELSLWIYTWNVMADAAKAGVRYAIVHGSNTSSASGPSSCPSPCTLPTSCTTNSSNVSAVQDEVVKWARFSVYSTSSISVTVCYMDGNNKAPSRVQVKVSNPTTAFFSNLWSAPAVTATAQGRIVN